jgi:hypothetical protein
VCCRTDVCLAIRHNAVCTPHAPPRRSLLSVLHPAFMAASDNLRTQLEAAVATANQHPDTLDAFIAWESTMQLQLQSRPTLNSWQGTAGVRMGSAGAAQGTGGGMVSGRGSFGAADAVRVGLLMEVEALREMLEVLRWVGKSRQWHSEAAGCWWHDSLLLRHLPTAGHFVECMECICRVAAAHVFDCGSREWASGCECFPFMSQRLRCKLGAPASFAITLSIGKVR